MKPNPDDEGETQDKQIGISNKTVHKKNEIPLWNIYSKEELVKKLKESGLSYITVSFYQYAHIKNPSFFRDYLFPQWSKLNIVGRTYVAKEGINAQISVPIPHFEQFRKELYEISFLEGVRLNIAVSSGGIAHPFLKLKIKVRDKIVADGLLDETFDVCNKGKHLTAEEFNRITEDPDTLLIDFRNHYESEVGHFKGAITPKVNTFRESLPIIEEQYLKGNENKNIVMYCTGGIRCEKASAWFKHRGFKHVHQLEGGIIKYTNDCKNLDLENKFIGKNFVFDERLGERISKDVIAKCHQCGAPCDNHTNCKNDACNLLLIQCDSCKEQYENCCSLACQKIIHLPFADQKSLRKGKLSSNKIYTKKT
jgi:UPF0176 protein